MPKETILAVHVYNCTSRLPFLEPGNLSLSPAGPPLREGPLRRRRLAVPQGFHTEVGAAEGSAVIVRTVFQATLSQNSCFNVKTFRFEF